MTSTTFEYRLISPEDHDRIKALHEECFPVRYSDSFYRNACMGQGFRGGSLYTCLCVEQATKLVVGFIIAHVQPENEVEDTGLLGVRLSPDIGSSETGRAVESDAGSVRQVCYILTLGLDSAYRRAGLGSRLLEHCIAYARCNRNCGAVYLHVIHNNPSAIAFYKRNDFLQLRSLSNFYIINGERHTAFLLIFYINGFQRPGATWQRLLASMRNAVGGVISWLSGLWYPEPPQATEAAEGKGGGELDPV